MGSGMIIEAEQALDKFGTHAGDFGAPTNPNFPNFRRFLRALRSHVGDPATVTIVRTYRNNIPATHSYNASSGLLVGTDGSGSFISGWHLYPSQVIDLLSNGHIR